MSTTPEETLSYFSDLPYSHVTEPVRALYRLVPYISNELIFDLRPCFHCLQLNVCRAKREFQDAELYDGLHPEPQSAFDAKYQVLSGWYEATPREIKTYLSYRRHAATLGTPFSHRPRAIPRKPNFTIRTTPSFAPPNARFTFELRPPRAPSSSRFRAQLKRLRYPPLRLPTALPTWHKAYLVPIGVPDTPEMRRELAGRVASALLDDITLDIRTSPESSPSMQNQNHLQPMITYMPVFGPTMPELPLPATPMVDAFADVTPCDPMASLTVKYPSPIARPSRIIPPVSPTAAPLAPTPNTHIGTGLPSPPPSILPTLDARNSVGRTSPLPALNISPAIDIHSNSGLFPPFDRQSPSCNYLPVPISPADQFANVPFIMNPLTMSSPQPAIPNDDFDFDYTACSLSPSTTPSPAVSSSSTTSSLAPPNLSPTFLDTLAMLIGSIDHNTVSQHHSAAAPSMMCQDGFQGGAQGIVNQYDHDSSSSSQQPSPFLLSPLAPTEMRGGFATYAPFPVSPSPLLGVSTEEAERARLLPQQSQLQLPLSYPPLLSPGPGPAPISVHMERHTTFPNQQPSASPVFRDDSPGSSPVASPSSSSSSSRYTDYMYGYGGNGHSWWDHDLHEQQNTDFVQDEEGLHYHYHYDYDYYRHYSHGDGNGNGNGEMEPLCSIVGPDEDDSVDCDNFLDMDSDGSEGDELESVLDYYHSGGGASRGAQPSLFDRSDPTPSSRHGASTNNDNTNSDSIIDGDSNTPPPMENSLAVLNDEEDLGDGWAYIPLDQSYDHASESDDLFSFVDTPSSTSCGSRRNEEEEGFHQH